MTKYLAPLKKGAAHPHYFVNNVFAEFFNGIGRYFQSEWYTRSTDIIFSTYEKAVERIRNRNDELSEKYRPEFPFIIFNPQYDFQPVSPHGMMFYGFPNFNNRLAAKMYRPVIYEDDNLYIAPVLNRYEGTIEMVIHCSSVYELYDWRMFTYQFFGGEGRPIYPKLINAYITLPDELLIYDYNNRYTGDSYTLDWTTTSSEARLIKNINQNRLVYPFELSPWIVLDGVSDGSDKYGGAGAEEISEHRLVVSMKWEAPIPVHLLSVAYEQPLVNKQIHIDMGIGFHYVKASEDRSDAVKLSTPHNLFSMYIKDGDSTSVTKVDMIHDQSYNYIITADDYANIEADENFSVTIPQAVDDGVFLRIYGKHGVMDEFFHWKLADSTTVEFVGFNMTNMSEGDMISIEIYTEGYDTT